MSTIRYLSKRRGSILSWAAGVVLVALPCVCIATSAAAPGPGTLVEGRLELRPSPPAVPLTDRDGGIQLILDDGSQEAAFGVTSGVGGAQFLWFNQFAVGPAVAFFRLEEIWVLFPGGTGLATGDAIQLVIFQDVDGTPANGNELLGTIDETIQFADDVTFSRYPVDPPITVSGDGTVILGVVNRWVQTGISPPTSPASLDLDQPQGRSWIATWIGDPPDPPLLPSDGALVPIDDFDPGAAGNWMIRGFGTAPSVVEIPALDRHGASLLVLILLAVGLARLAAGE